MNISRMYSLKELDRIGMTCARCGTEVVLEASSPLTVLVPQQCPACGEILPDQGQCLNMYRRMFQSPCAETLRLYVREAKP